MYCTVVAVQLNQFHLRSFRAFLIDMEVMAGRRKEEVDAARHRQEKREATRLGKLLPQTEA